MNKLWKIIEDFILTVVLVVLLAIQKTEVKRKNMVNFYRTFVGELMDNPRFKVFLYVTGMVCLGTFGVVLDYLRVPIGYIVLVISALVLPLGYGMYILGRQMGIINNKDKEYNSKGQPKWVEDIRFLLAEILRRSKDAEGTHPNELIENLKHQLSLSDETARQVVTDVLSVLSANKVVTKLSDDRYIFKDYSKSQKK